MSRKIILTVVTVAAVILSLCFLGACGLFPSDDCDHKYEVVKETGDCYKDGIILKKCTKCGYQVESINHAGHRYETIDHKDKTCFEDGYTVQKCSRCGATQRNTINKGHDYRFVSSTATCEESGIATSVCSGCGDKKEEAVFASGHNYVPGGEKQPTCTEEGAKISVCSKCGDEKRESIAALGHVPVPIGDAVEATCTEFGHTAGKKCERCEAVLEAQQQLPKEHKLDDNEKCVYCGEIFKKYTVTFDLNDGAIPTTQQVVHGSAPEFPTAPEKPDSVFIGWYIGEQKCDEAYTVTADITVVAKYEQIVSIRDAEGLKAIADNPNGAYKLVSDINMRGEALPVIDEFGGVLDGNGHTVRDSMLNFIAVAKTENYGFICVNTGEIKNITFSDFLFTGKSANENRRNINEGVVVGVNKGVVHGVTLRGGMITMDFDNYIDSRSRLEFKTNFGGIVGLNDAGATISDCTNCLPFESKMYFGNYNSSTLYAGDERVLTGSVGGIVGANNGNIINCSYEGSISVSAYGRNMTANGGAYYESSNINACVGGIVGLMYESGNVSKCYSSGEFKLNSRVGNYGHIYGYIGGIAALNYGRIDDSFATGSAEGNAFDSLNMGGLVGENHSTGRLSTSHTSVEILAKMLSNNGAGAVGGVVGKNSASVQKCYATGNITTVNKITAGGFVGCNASGGTVRNSYCTGNVTASNEDKMSLSDCGYFVGKSELSSVLYKCRYFSGEIVMRGGIYLEKSNETGDNVAQSVTAEELWTEDFLRDKFNWDTEDGWIVFNEDNPILSWELERGHHFETKTIAPTHEYKGYTAYHCSDCGRVYISDYTDALGHTYEKVRTVAPTCTEQGYDVVHCTKDGCDFDGEVHINFTPAKEHSKIDNAEPVSVTTAATCGAAGLGEYRCGVCGENFTAEIPATGNHTWVDVEEKAAVVCASDARGEEGHSAYKYCSVCELVDGKIITTPHTDKNLDNLCDVCKELTFTTVSRSEFVEISDAEGFKAIKDNLGKSYILTKDINLVGAAWSPIGTKTAPFTGILYGNGHSIIGLTNNVDSANDVTATGLFAYNSGKIIGVTLSGFTLNAQNSSVVFGGIAAYNNGEIISCVIKGDNTLQYYSEKKIVSVGNDSGSGAEFTLTAGGFAGINGAKGRVVDCELEGRIDSKNAVYGEITLNIGSTIWSAAGSVLNNIIFNTQLNVSQNVTFGGLVGMNSGEVSKCIVSGEVNLYSIAQANLVQLKGKLNVKTELYAGSLIGYNGGVVSDNSAAAIKYDIPSEYKNIGIPYILTGNAYKLTYEITNHGAEGDGKIGVDGTAKSN